MAVVTFLPNASPPLFVEVDTGLETNSMQWAEIYFDWKEWMRGLGSDGGKYPPLFDVEGGRYTGEGDDQKGITHYVQSPWKFRAAEYSHRVRLIGDYLYQPDPSHLFWVPTAGNYNVHIETRVSNLVEKIAIGSGVTTQDKVDIAALSAVASRDAILSDSTPFAGANLDAVLSSLATASSLETVAATLSAAAARIQRFAEENGHESGATVVNTTTGPEAGPWTTERRVNGALRTTIVTTDPLTSSEQATVTPE